MEEQLNAREQIRATEEHPPALMVSWRFKKIVWKNYLWGLIGLDNENEDRGWEEKKDKQWVLLRLSGFSF